MFGLSRTTRDGEKRSKDDENLQNYPLPVPGGQHTLPVRKYKKEFLNFFLKIYNWAEVVFFFYNVTYFKWYKSPKSNI